MFSRECLTPTGSSWMSSLLKLSTHEPLSSIALKDPAALSLSLAIEFETGYHFFKFFHENSEIIFFDFIAVSYRFPKNKYSGVSML